MAEQKELTKEQEELIPIWREKWLNIGLSVEETNVAIAEEGVREAYKSVNLPVPDKIYWRESPQAGARLAASLLLDKPESEVTKAEAQEQISKACHGQFDAAWLGYYDYFLEVVKLDLHQICGQIKIAKSCCWWWPFDEAVVLTKRPYALNRDPEGRLHCEDGPAIAWKDNFGVYAWHGIRVPQHVIEKPETITVDEIEKEQNVEVRRVMITRYGQDKYLLDSGAKEVQKDDWGILYRKEIPNDEAIVMVKVVNSTPESDGSFKDYFIRVPPNVTSAKDAVSWTFDEKDYNPSIQT